MYQKINKGLNIPINGQPKTTIDDNKLNTKKFAFVSNGFVNLRPKMLVKENSIVKKGEPLFYDKTLPRAMFTSPISGKVSKINRGAKRYLLSIEIDKIDNSEQVEFKNSLKTDIESMSKQQAIDLMLESGVWNFVKNRPFGTIADYNTIPSSIFVNCMDSSPLAPEFNIIINNQTEYINIGLKVLDKILEGKKYIHLCKSPNTKIKESDININTVKIHNFEGKHPSGLVGTHIHHIDPVNIKKNVWYINVQNLIIIGKLFKNGILDFTKIVSLAGPGVINPRLIRTYIGASIEDIIKNEIHNYKTKVIDGSILYGYTYEKETGYVSYYTNSISIIKHDDSQDFIGWIKPGSNKYSFGYTVLSKLFKNKLFDLTNAINGGLRAIVPIGIYEKLIPMDIIVIFLLRSLEILDINESESLGCLELEEEDLGLVTFVCPSKVDHSLNLRKVLNTFLQ